MPITVFNSFEKTVLGISECNKGKNFLKCIRLKRCEKTKFTKIGKKSLALCALKLFQFFLNLEKICRDCCKKN